MQVVVADRKEKALIRVLVVLLYIDANWMSQWCARKKARLYEEENGVNRRQAAIRVNIASRKSKGERERGSLFLLFILAVVQQHSFLLTAVDQKGEEGKETVP